MKSQSGSSVPTAGSDAAPSWQPAALGVAPVNHVLFVDKANYPGVGGGNGTLASPYQTIQEAVDRAVVDALPSVYIRIAPGLYQEPIFIPESLPICSLCGWNQADAMPEISGDITAVTSAGSTNKITLENIIIGRKMGIETPKTSTATEPKPETPGEQEQAK